MMHLGGASPTALEYARVWRCPVCSEVAQPPKMMTASPVARPYGFNKVVCIDVKYLKDTSRQNRVCLSMVDAGTAYHVAVMLRNRSSEHVSRRILEHWILHYGAPERFAIDLGGEFLGVFLDMCEEFNIDVKAAGANAPWQHVFASATEASWVESGRRRCSSWASTREGRP